MLPLNILVGICVLYVAFLFAVAFWADSRAAQGRSQWLNSPLIYTLSLSVYCTAWTFYGAVGYAARSGPEFITIYLGPTLVMIAWWTILRRLVRIGRSQRVTSIADLISSRYGKSNLLGVLVTLLAVVGTTPYIALQLQSVTLSFEAFAPDAPGQTAFWVAAGLAVFTILFGTRNLDVNEQHPGVVIAIAVEAVVKLVALLAVGIFVVFIVADGPTAILAEIETSQISEWELKAERWMTLIFLSGAAFLCLPRMFQVLVVENSDESHLAVASWAFPLYLFLVSLFVVPIAVVGLKVIPEGANPDLYVLTVPLAFDREGLATLAFLGGFSSATSMVIVASIALSTMVSNHIVMPIWLNARQGGATVSGDVRDVVITARRLSIAGVLGLGYLYYQLSGGGAALASIGLIAFTGVAQFLPALIGGVFWRGATRVGAAVGVSVGFVVWLWTSYLPSFGVGLLSEAVLSSGPFGIEALRPTALFGIDGIDPLVHAVFWSLSLNTVSFIVFSLLTFPTPLERLQGATFVNILRTPENAASWSGGVAEAEDLLLMSQRILGPVEAQALFTGEAARQGKDGYLPDVSPDFLDRVERELAGSVGTATAHAMMSQITGGVSVSVEDLMRVADEAQQIMEYSSQLEAKSKELGQTAGQLKEANEKLVALSVQKDAFLSQISHELRTPMTSIRSFSEILMSSNTMTAEDRLRYSSIVHEETLRLTRLLDDLLDLSVLENGQVTLNPREDTLAEVLDRAVAATLPFDEHGTLTIDRDLASETAVSLYTDSDRLAQVFINLIANAQKYCDADSPELTIRVAHHAGRDVLDFVDNGSGIPKEAQTMIFEKFARGTDSRAAGGAGLGLAICREIMTRLGGSIAYLPSQGGAAFRVTLPARPAAAA